MRHVKFMTIILAMAGVVMFSQVCGCSEGDEGPAAPTPGAKKPSTGTADKPAEMTQEEKEALADKKYEDLRSYADGKPDDLITIEARYEEIKKLAPGTASEMKARAILNSARKTWDKKASEKFDEIAAEVKQAFEQELAEPVRAPLEKVDSYSKILEILDKFPAKYMNSEYSAKLLELKKPVVKAMEAADAYEKLRFKALSQAGNKNWKEAIETLDEYPAKYRDSEWEKVRQEKLAEYRAQLNKQVEAEKQVEQMTFYKLYDGQPIDKTDFQVEGDWKIENGVLVGSAGPGSESVIAYSGGSDWSDVVYRIKMRIVRGSITLAVRGTEVKENTLRYDPISLSTGILDANKWYTFNATLKGKKYVVTAEPPLSAPQEYYADKESGPMAIWVKSDSVIHVESIEVGFFDKVPASFVEEAARQKSSGEEKEDENGG